MRGKLIDVRELDELTSQRKLRLISCIQCKHAARPNEVKALLSKNLKQKSKMLR